MGKVTDLENIKWRAGLMLEGGDEPVEPDDLREIAMLIMGLAVEIERVLDRRSEK